VFAWIRKYRAQSKPDSAALKALLRRAVIVRDLRIGRTETQKPMEIAAKTTMKSLQHQSDTPATGWLFLLYFHSFVPRIYIFHSKE